MSFVSPHEANDDISPASKRDDADIPCAPHRPPLVENIRRTITDTIHYRSSRNVKTYTTIYVLPVFLINDDKGIFGESTYCYLKADDEQTTLLKLRLSMGDGNHLVYDGSQAVQSHDQNHYPIPSESRKETPLNPK
ncbi:hypothetical protein EVAR_52972_1 [Eumeta japonica]|uniref:Uncharacterized protein n=1 Tax=Eumeta variegata TaxID=151549 RepID=A0A4C1YYF4_EUMVA|nr:hypothetical protein EVAR_52972_1 [Eumeta japonica]